MKSILYLILGIIALSSIYALTDVWVSDPNSCPVIYNSVSCPGSKVVCGVNPSDLPECYEPSLLTPPSVKTNSTIVNYSAGFEMGGYILNCTAYDNAAPFCDNRTGMWCQRNETYFKVQNRTTVCTNDAWLTVEMGNCKSTNFNCVDDAGDVCEATSSSDCSGCTQSNCRNSYITSGCNDRTGGGSCQCDSTYFACDGSIVDADGCELNTDATCGSSTGLWQTTQCIGSTGNCTAHGGSANNRDCFNIDSDNNTITCNGGLGCNITSGNSCSAGTGTWTTQCLFSSSTGLPTSGNCTSSTKLDCDNSDSDTDPATCNGGNGCEITIGAACTVGTLAGVYGSTCSGAAGNCIVSAQHHLTNQSADGSSTHANLWTVQWGVGDIFNGTSAYRNMTIAINNSACIYWPDSGRYICSNTSNYFGYSCGAGNVVQGTYVNGSPICAADVSGGSSDFSGYVNLSMFGSIANASIVRDGNRSWFLTNLTVSDANLTYSSTTGVFSLTRLNLALFFNSLNWINDSTGGLINYENKSVANRTIVDMVKLNITSHETNYKHGNTTVEIRSQFRGSKNISFDSATGEFSLNISTGADGNTDDVSSYVNNTNFANQSIVRDYNRSWFLTNFTVSDTNLTYSPTTGVFSLIRLNLAHFFNSLNWINDSTSALINYYTKADTNTTINFFTRSNITTHETNYKHGNTTIEILNSINNSNLTLYNVSAVNLKGNLPWTNLTDYPLSCAAGFAITQLDDTITCAAFVSTESDPFAIKNSSTANLTYFTAINASIFNLSIGGNMTFQQCKSASIETNSNGVVVCGTDASGSGSDFNNSDLNVRMVNATFGMYRDNLTTRNFIATGNSTVGFLNVTQNLTMGNDRFILGNSTGKQYIKFNASGIFIRG